MLITLPISSLLRLDTTICCRFQLDGLQLSKNGIFAKWRASTTRSETMRRDARPVPRCSVFPSMRNTP
jgi:hypothetical protein